MTTSSNKARLTEIDNELSELLLLLAEAKKEDAENHLNALEGNHSVSNYQRVALRNHIQTLNLQVKQLQAEKQKLKNDRVIGVAYEKVFLDILFLLLSEDERESYQKEAKEKIAELKKALNIPNGHVIPLDLYESVCISIDSDFNLVVGKPSN